MCEARPEIACPAATRWRVRDRQLRGDVQVNRNAALVAVVNAVVHLGVLFECRARTAPEGLVFRAQPLPRSGRHGKEVGGMTSLGLDSAQPVVEKIALVVVEVVRIRSEERRGGEGQRS